MKVCRNCCVFILYVYCKPIKLSSMVEGNITREKKNITAGYKKLIGRSAAKNFKTLINVLLVYHLKVHYYK